MTPRVRRVFRLACLAGVWFAAAAPGWAVERFALVVTGASGSAAHGAAHAKWADVFATALLGPLGLPDDHVVVLKAGGASGAESATRERVAQAIRGFSSRMTRDDLLTVVLIGHGTFDGVDAKFNLVGPDLTAEEWRGLIQAVPGRTVFVNTASASAPFLGTLAGSRRIVIAATDTPAQQYDTVFPEYFVAAFASDEADLDKDGRVSIGEAFAHASMRVKRHYAERGQLATERALLDDNGDGEGEEAGSEGNDGSIASRTFLDAGPEVGASRDPAISELLARRDALELALDELKRKKDFMPADDYARELERLLIDHARLSRRLRTRS